MKNLNDFKNFLSSKDKSPPSSLDQEILSFVQKDLNPDKKITFSKFLFIHATVGVISLLFCPQFELSLTNKTEVFHFFHYHFGMYVCYATCGSIFIGSGAIMASALLKKSELDQIRSSKGIAYICFALISLFFFSLFGASIELSSAFFWVIGASLSGALILEVQKILLKLRF